MSAHQKLSLGVFIVIGLSTVVLGFFRINKAIDLPFRRTGTFTFKTADQLEKERTQKLRESDTDTDGLNDYDELYVFRTSPFLEDSDSDGLNDGAEVASESDPNCPKGRTCRQEKIFAASTAVGTPTDGTGSTGSGTNPATGSAGTPTGGTSASAEARILEVIEETFGPLDQLTPKKIADGMEKMPPNELRAFLTRLGIPAQALSGADDATLRQLLKETLDELSANPPPGTTPDGGVDGTDPSVN